MNVAPGHVATVEYTVRLADGTSVDSTGACGPVSVLIGSGQLFPALEDRLLGMVAGETRSFHIPPEEAYGAWHAELVRTVPRDRLPPDLDLQVGAEYRVSAEGERTLRFRVVGIDADGVRADFNARGAGQVLEATVTVVALREATAAETQRGRV